MRKHGIEKDGFRITPLEAGNERQKVEGRGPVPQIVAGYFSLDFNTPTISMRVCLDIRSHCRKVVSLAPSSMT